MRKTILMVFVMATAMLIGSMAMSQDSEVPDVSVDELAVLLAANEATVCDANGQATRERFGTIPNAVLLSGGDFDATELGENQEGTFVFYCSNEMCSAGPSAASRAREAGFTDVRVLRAGIMGWVAAGQAVAQLEPAAAE